MLASEYVKKGWTQGPALARMADGRACPPHSPEATSWCLIGSLMAAYPFVEFPKARLMLKRLQDVLGLANLTDILRWNEAKGRTQAEVVEALERAGL